MNLFYSEAREICTNVSLVYMYNMHAIRALEYKRMQLEQLAEPACNDAEEA